MQLPPIPTHIPIGPSVLDKFGNSIKTSNSFSYSLKKVIIYHYLCFLVRQFPSCTRTNRKRGCREQAT